MNTEWKLEQIRRLAHASMKTAPSTRNTWRHSLGWLMALNGALTVFMAALLSRHSMPWVSLWSLTGFVLAAFLVAGMYAALSPTLRPSRLWVALLVMVVASLSLAVVPVMSNEEPLVASGMRCLVTEFALSVVPVTLCLLMLRRFAYHPVRTWLGILASGLVGLFTLHWHCQVLTGEHVLWFHLAPWLAVGILGVWIRSKLRSRTFVP